MRIGIVNDMPLAREALRRLVTSSGGHEVAWLANDGVEAVKAARLTPADLILMDLIMPGMDGVEATRLIMSENPCPILIVTATVTGNCSMVYDAMGHGALDAADTPSIGPGGTLSGGEYLLAKISTVGKLTGKLSGRFAAIPPGAATQGRPRPEETLVAIGASTGGPNALAEVLSAFPKPWPTTVIIIQHVDVDFSAGLARWLSERSGHPVELAEAGKIALPGQFLLAGTNDHLVLEHGKRFCYCAEPLHYHYRPSVDVFFQSVARHWPALGVAALLTGMGRDGASGLLTLRRAGWLTIAQDESTSIVFGMPRAAAEMSAAMKILPISRIGGAIVEHVHNRA